MAFMNFRNIKNLIYYMFLTVKMLYLEVYIYTNRVKYKVIKNPYPNSYFYALNKIKKCPF